MNGTLVQLSGSTLTAGTWLIKSNATLSISNAQILSNQGNVTLDGPNSTFTAINPLQQNIGSFTITNGRAFQTAGPLSNDGSMQVGPSSVLTASGPLSGAGSLSVSGTGAQVILPTLSQSAVSISAGGTIALLPSATGGQYTNIATSLSITGGGSIDLSNHNLLTSTPTATMRQYLQAGYSNGNWNGTGGVTSSWAAGDATHSSALGYSLRPDGSTLVAATIYGDADLSGRVTIADFNILSANFRLNTGNQTWDRGDFNYNGSVTIQDYNLLSAQFGKRVNAGSPNLALASSTSATLTASPSFSPANHQPAPGTLEFYVDTEAGHVYLVANQALVSSYDLESSDNNAAGDFLRANWTKLSALSGTLSAANQSYELDQESLPGSPCCLTEPSIWAASFRRALPPTRRLPT